MRNPLLLGTVALFLRGAKAAPKALEDRVAAHVLQGRTFRSDPDPGAWSNPGRGRHGHHRNSTNATAPAGTGGTASSTFSPPLNVTSTSMPPECPLSVVTSTTTVDVTFYVTATTSYAGNLTSSSFSSSSGTGTAHSSFTSSQPSRNSTTSRATWVPSSTSIQLSTGFTRPVNSSATVSSAASESPCSDDAVSTLVPQNTTSLVSYTASASSVVIITTSSSSSSSSSSTSALPSQSTEPCDDDLLSTSLPNSTAISTSTGSSVAPSAQTTSAAITPIPNESCVIDTSMVPVTSAALTSVPSSTLVPTKTVCQDDAPTGKPMPGNHHCGVHGLPVGNYFLARFVENSPGVPVTLEGCYQFCASVMNAPDGCRSYRFYPERALNVPRCDLYGSNVAYALDSINNDHPDLWFDLTCGSPSDPRWAHLPGMTRLRDLGLLE